MDNFDYKAYLRNNPLLQPEDKLIKESEDISEKKYKPYTKNQLFVYKIIFWE